MQKNHPAPQVVKTMVSLALDEDIGRGDLSASLITKHTRASAQLLAREEAVLCGQKWFEAAFRALAPSNIRFRWFYQDRDIVEQNSIVCQITGPAHAMLSAERTAINFLQFLSGTATQTAIFSKKLAKYPNCLLVDTRKTIPGFRIAQKYAVRCGGGHNHRFGLYDQILIKENHIRALGGIAAALKKAQKTKSTVQIEVESTKDLSQALEAGATMVLLDNFSVTELKKAVHINQKRAILEASGNITLRNIEKIAQTGIDRISIGSLTKYIIPIDFSLVLK